MMTNRRLHELDWLRVIAIAILLLYHVGMIFVSWEWHIKSAEMSRRLEYVMSWLHQWRMPLLLFISGAGTYFALGVRTPAAFARERFRRLIVPLVFGMVVIVPPQIYYERIDQFGSFAAFYPTVFELVPYPMGGSLSWHHLWFILYLFLFALIALPLFVAVRNGKTERWFALLRRIVSTKIGFTWLIVPVIASQFVLRPFFPDETHDLVNDWAFFTLYFSWFLLGFLCVADRELWNRVRETRRQHLGLAAGILVPYYVLRYIALGSGSDLFMTLYDVTKIFAAWYTILALAGWGQLLLRFRTRFLDYANEAVYPFYILHQTLIVVIGWHVLQRFDGIWGNFALITLMTFASSMLIYHFAIRPFGVMRLLFGMKRRKRVEGTTEASAWGASPLR